MARIRSIKPEFPQSETIGALSREGRLLFIQLWTLADDDGRARAASRMLASLLYPYDDDAPGLMQGWLEELVIHDCIELYEVAGAKYLRIINWLKHQKIDRPSKSRLPVQNEPLANPREPSRILDADLGPRTLKKELPEADASGADAPPDPKKEYFRRSRDVLGKSGSGFAAKLLRSFGNEDDLKAIAKARSRIEEASTKANPAEWLGRVLAPKNGEFKLMSGMEGVV